MEVGFGGGLVAAALGVSAPTVGVGGPRFNIDVAERAQSAQRKEARPKCQETLFP
jgi:hypothetical protein